MVEKTRGDRTAVRESMKYKATQCNISFTYSTSTNSLIRFPNEKGDRRVQYRNAVCLLPLEVMQSGGGCNVQSWPLEALMALHQCLLQSYLSAGFFFFSEREQAVFSSLHSSRQGTLSDHLSDFVLRQRETLTSCSHTKTELWWDSFLEQKDSKVTTGISPTMSKGLCLF